MEIPDPEDSREEDSPVDEMADLLQDDGHKKSYASIVSCSISEITFLEFKMVLLLINLVTIMVQFNITNYIQGLHFLVLSSTVDEETYATSHYFHVFNL